MAGGQQYYLSYSFYWAIAALAGFVFSLLLAWHLISPLNFFYAQFYGPVGIGENIVEYGPLNRNRSGFETTTREEHERLMSELVQSINDGGKGLAEIDYLDRSGKPIARFLTAAEITHLEDVAHLVNGFNVVGVVLGVLLLVMVIIARWRKLEPPKLSRLLRNMLALIVLISLIVLVIGPVEVFYWLHEWIFPAKNQWFFYYEDSLMTTLLKAPVIFGPIAVAWLLIAFLCWLFLFFMVLRMNYAKNPVF